MRLICRLFGSPTAVLSDERGERPLPGRLLGLLAYLIAHRGKALARAHVAATLWPDSPEETGRTNLRRYLHLLMQALGPDAGGFLHAKGATIEWRADAPLTCDLLEFHADPAALPGEFLAGWYDDWIEPHREQLARAHRESLSAIFEQAAEADDYAGALEAGERLLEADPLNERTLRTLMSLRAARGDRAGALDMYRRFEQRLAGEFAAQPHEETARVFDDVLAGSPDAAVPGNLPQPRTRFIGRERDAGRVRELMQSSRLVTITGAGGVGKSRLALRAASAVKAQFEDGVWIVECSGARDRRALEERLAQCLDPSGHIADARAFALGKLSQARALIIFDACEHLAPAAASLIGSLLAETPVRCMATSRKRLMLEGESVYALAPFDLPPAGMEPEQLAATEAGKLFLDRASIVAPEFAFTHANVAAAHEIIERLNGVPLALELACSRLSLLTVEGIAKRLSDHFEQFTRNERTRDMRRSSLHEIVKWSYDLLSPREQRLFATLGVFPGDWTLEAAQAVAGGVDIFDVFSELVEASLVHVRPHGGGIRYTMLDATRAFARSAFQALPDRKDIQRRHAEHFARFLHEGREHLQGPGAEAFFIQCALEIDNLRAAQQWAFEEEYPLAVAIAVDAGPFWWRTPYILDGRAAMQRALSDAQFPSLSPLLQGRVHHAAGIIARVLSELQPSAEHMERAIELFRRAGDAGALGRALMGLGVARFYHGDYDGSRALLLEALPLMREHCTPTDVALLLGNLGAADLAVGRLEDAQTYLQESAALFESLGAVRFHAQQRVNLSLVHYLRRDAGAAIENARMAIAALEEAQAEPYRIADAYCKLSMGLRLENRIEEAWHANVRALALLEDGRHKSAVAEALEDAARTLLARGAERTAWLALERASFLRAEIAHPPNPVERDELGAAREAAQRSIPEPERAAISAIAASLPLNGLIETLRKESGTVLGRATA